MFKKAHLWLNFLSPLAHLIMISPNNATRLPLNECFSSGVIQLNNI